MGVFYLLDDPQVGVESVANCGAEADSISTTEFDKEGCMLVVINKFSKQECSSLVYVC